MENCLKVYASSKPSDFEHKKIDIQQASKQELVELLERQEKMLLNKSLISKLPDGGEKIRSKAAAIRRRLGETDDAMTDIKDIKPANVETLSPPATLTSKMDTSEGLSIIEKGFGDMAIHEGPFYDVVKKAAARKSKSKFVLNRSPMSPNEGKASLNNNKDNEENAESQMDDSSSEPKEETRARLISVEECRSLHVQQHIIQKKQEAELMADRILTKYGLSRAPSGPKDAHCHPEGTSCDVINDPYSDVELDECHGDLSDVDGVD